MPKKGVSKNTSRLNSDMQRVLIDIIEGMKDPRLKNGLLTVTHVENAPDLSTCKVYVSVLGSGENDAKEAVASLDRAKGHVRSEIANRMSHIRRAPELIFIEDTNAAYAAHINKVMKEL